MLIDVLIGGQTKYYPDGVPYVEGGKPAIMDTADLDLKSYTIDNDVESTTIWEYWEGNELRHRSVAMRLKQSVSSLVEQALLG